MCKLIDFATKNGFVVTGGELERKIEMQEIYIRTGRSKTINSMHLKRCAIDLNFFRDVDGKLQLTYDIPTLKAVGDFWEGLRPEKEFVGRQLELVQGRSAFRAARIAVIGSRGSAEFPARGKGRRESSALTTAVSFAWRM